MKSKGTGRDDVVTGANSSRFNIAGHSDSAADTNQKSLNRKVMNKNKNGYKMNNNSNQSSLQRKSGYA